ncbi:hypothetical protein COW64_09490 [bacterium (Candidatus Blackallbacteria) CG18_big_fil_WC_8_21_14_2_50_49_26]|nr:MAG: hypothetical protein COW64_09490 [bacterium (Candidatus Blackallbacteria) CG18_big_fil_WC_8_21_14_2_50_49_26]
MSPAQAQILDSHLDPGGFLASGLGRSTCQGCDAHFYNVDQTIAQEYTGLIAQPPDIGNLGGVADRLIQKYPALNQPQNRDRIVAFLTMVAENDPVNLSDKLFRAEAAPQGVAPVVGVVGGNAGHHMNSIMASLDQLAATNRLNANLLDTLNAFPNRNALKVEVRNEWSGILKSTLQNIAYPNTISQHSKGTCAPTTIEMMVALKNPQQYVQFVGDLASNYKIHEDHLMMVMNGDPGINVPDSAKQPDTHGRSPASRLMQESFQNYVRQVKNEAYDPAAPGAYSEETTILVNSIYGFLAYDSYSSTGRPLDGYTQKTPAEMVDMMKDMQLHNEPIPVHMAWYDSHGMKAGSHAVLVTQIDEAHNSVRFANPWGQMNSMPIDDFKSRMIGILTINTGRLEPYSDSVNIVTPHQLTQPNNYHALDWKSYQSVGDHLTTLLNEKLSQAGSHYAKLAVQTDFDTTFQPAQLHAKFEALKIPLAKLDDIIHMNTLETARPPRFTTELMTKLLAENDPVQAQTLIDTYKAKVDTMQAIKREFNQGRANLTQIQVTNFQTYINRVDDIPLSEIQTARDLLDFCQAVNQSGLKDAQKNNLLQPFNLHTPGWGLSMVGLGFANPDANILVGDGQPQALQNARESFQQLLIESRMQKQGSLLPT